MDMVKVEPLVPYSNQSGFYKILTIATAYQYEKYNMTGYEVFFYDFCISSRVKFDVVGSYTQVNITAYIRAGANSWADTFANPHIKNFEVLYMNDEENLITAVRDNVEYEMDSVLNLNCDTVTIDGTNVYVFPYHNMSFEVRHNTDGTPQIDAQRSISINAQCSYNIAQLQNASHGICLYDETEGFKTRPYKARITGAGSFYNQVSIDNGTATHFILPIKKTTDIYPAENVYDENDNMITVYCTQRIGLSTDGVNADIIPFTEVDCETGNIGFTITAEIQNNLLKWCNDAKSKPIYYILETTYRGYGYRDIAQRYFMVGSAEPILNFKYEDYYPVTTALTGDNQAWVKNASKLEYTLATSAQKYAHIVSRYVKCGTYQADGLGSCEIIEPDGDYIEVGCTDSRGFTASKIITPTKVYDYFKPTAVIHCSNMTGDGDVKLSFSGRFKAVSFTTGLNPLTLQFRYKKSTDADYGDWITIEEMTNQKIGSNGEYACDVVLSGLDYQATYYYQARIIDAINTIVSAEIAGVSIPVFDWSETDFNFNVPVTIKGEAAERIHTKGTDGIWTYILWDSGLCECWGTYSGSANLSNSEGALYYSDDITINYPAGYSYFDNVLVSGGGTGASWVRTTDGSSNSKVTFKIVGAASGNVAVTTHIHAWGLWK